MREVTFEETRKIQLGILDFFDDWCKKHGLHYSLGEGTLIGAIRHQGFIPWDDDIDLLMPREDFDKFVETYDGKFRLISLRTEKRWRSCYIRLTDERTTVKWDNPNHNYHGLWISILPIDNYPDDSNDWTKLKSKIKKYVKMGWVKDSYWRKDASLGRNIVKLPLKIIMLPVSSNHIGRCLQRFITSFNSEKTKNKGQMACVWHEPWVFDADLISDYVEVCFEGRKFPALKGYDAYLRGQYGDYMKLPPESQRVPKHDYIAYWKD